MIRSKVERSERSVLKLLWGLGLAGFLIMGLVNSSLAQSNESVELRPAVVELVGEPGSSQQAEIRVTNKSQVEQTYYPVIKNITSVGSGGRPEFSEVVRGDGSTLAEWVEVREESLRLAPGEDGVFRFSVDAPAEAGPGGHYAGFFVSRRAPDQRETGAAVGMDVAARLEFIVPGGAHEEALIREFSSSRGIYSEDQEIEFNILIENKGNVAARPIGTVEVTGWSGGEPVARLPVNANSRGIFGGSSLELPVASWQPEGWQFGRYRAELVLVYGETGRRTLTDEVDFWILPLNIIIPILVGLLFLVVGLFFGIRFYVNRQLKKAGHTRQSGQTLTAASAPVSKLTLIATIALLFTLVFVVVVLLLFVG